MSRENIGATLKEAQIIFGPDFFEPEEIAGLFHYKLSKKTLRALNQAWEEKVVRFGLSAQKLEELHNDTFALFPRFPETHGDGKKPQPLTLRAIDAFLPELFDPYEGSLKLMKPVLDQKVAKRPEWVLMRRGTVENYAAGASAELSAQARFWFAKAYDIDPKVLQRVRSMSKVVYDMIATADEYPGVQPTSRKNGHGPLCVGRNFLGLFVTSSLPAERNPIVL